MKYKNVQNLTNAHQHNYSMTNSHEDFSQNLDMLSQILRKHDSTAIYENGNKTTEVIFLPIVFFTAMFTCYQQNTKPCMLEWLSAAKTIHPTNQ